MATRWVNENAFDPNVEQAHRTFSVPVPIIKAIIGTESSFNKDAVRGEPQRGDASIGLMQILQKTAEGEGFGGTVQSLFMPAINIIYGTKHLKSLYDKLGDWRDVISAYNGGVRPHLGFGKKATRLIRGLCLAWDPNVPGKCLKRVDVQPGTYGNQAYVDKVLDAVKHFESDRAEGEGHTPVPMPKLGMISPELATRGMPVLALLLGLGAFLIFRTR